jgi:Bax protein
MASGALTPVAGIFAILCAMTRNFRKFSVIAAIGALLMFAYVAGSWGYSQRPVPAATLSDPVALVSPAPAVTSLEEVQVRDARELQRVFVEFGYVWPPEPGPSVPRIAINRLPDEFEWPEDVQLKKRMFFKILMPLAIAENAHVQRQRDDLESALEAVHGGDLPADHPAWRQLEALARDYQINGAPDDPVFHEALLNRIDAVPVELVLAQAANESGWGDSRFAREGNNLFGVWTYRPEFGIVPAARPAGETYTVRRYSTLRASVRSHIYNLNIGHAYEDLREMRAAMRARGEYLDALALAAGLVRYSSRGQDYVDEIRSIIRVNDLTRVARSGLRDAHASRVATARSLPSPSVGLQIAATTVD